MAILGHQMRVVLATGYGLDENVETQSFGHFQKFFSVISELSILIIAQNCYLSKVLMIWVDFID
jgi:hypothetical protein